jgi:hypothetical protein
VNSPAAANAAGPLWPRQSARTGAGGSGDLFYTMNKAAAALTEDQPSHPPFAAAHVVPWSGEIAVFRSPSTAGFELLTTFGSRARIGGAGLGLLRGSDFALRLRQCAGSRCYFAVFWGCEIG